MKATVHPLGGAVYEKCRRSAAAGNASQAPNRGTSKQDVGDVGQGGILQHVPHYLRWFKQRSALEERHVIAPVSCLFYLVARSQWVFFIGGRERGSGTMAVLWHCCWCPLNAHSGSGGLKSALKGLADQRSVSSVDSAAASNARAVLRHRSDAGRLTAESLMTSVPARHRE